MDPGPVRFAPVRWDPAADCCGRVQQIFASNLRAANDKSKKCASVVKCLRGVGGFVGVLLLSSGSGVEKVRVTVEELRGPGEVYIFAFMVMHIMRFRCVLSTKCTATIPAS